MAIVPQGLPQHPNMAPPAPIWQVNGHCWAQAVDKVRARLPPSATPRETLSALWRQLTGEGPPDWLSVFIEGGAPPPWIPPQAFPPDHTVDAILSLPVYFLHGLPVQLPARWPVSRELLYIRASAFTFFNTVVLPPALHGEDTQSSQSSVSSSKSSFFFMDPSISHGDGAHPDIPSTPAHRTLVPDHGEAPPACRGDADNNQPLTPPPATSSLRPAERTASRSGRRRSIAFLLSLFRFKSTP